MEHETSNTASQIWSDPFLKSHLQKHIKQKLPANAETYNYSLHRHNSKKISLGCCPATIKPIEPILKQIIYIHERFIFGLVLSGNHHYQFQLIIQPNPLRATVASKSPERKNDFQATI